MSETRRVQGRFEQRVALLCNIEAIRMYAAAHDGKFPDTLDASGVPVPADPFTGKSFSYTRDGTIATLSTNGIRFEIVLPK